MQPVSSWGRLSQDLHRVVTLSDASKVQDALVLNQPGLPFGMGRSYGDVCLNADGTLWNTTRLDRLIHFDALTGRLRAESGVLLETIQHAFVPRGWMLPVTPGTQKVTLGGAIANDVHGKNHHVYGSFGCHVYGLTLIRTDGECIECSPERNPAWFAATIGGLGLTGVIVEVELQLRRVSGPWLDTESIPYFNLSEFLQLADESERDWEYTVSWVDCLSKRTVRGVFMRGKHVHAPLSVAPSQRQLTVLYAPPVSLINQFSLRPFNRAYFHLHKRRTGVRRVHYEPFFYPLDRVLEWNRVYGRKGFFQYQSVVPREMSDDAIHAMLQTIAAAKQGSFLSVLKTFGLQKSPGLMSFPRPGVTLALDFPNQGQPTLALLDKLDEIVAEAGGRVYFAKNARMTPALLTSGYPDLDEFIQYRDPGISSGLSRRLLGS